MITRTLFLILSLIFVIGLSQPMAISQEKAFPNEEAWLWYLKPEPAKRGVNLARDTVVLVLKDFPPKGIQAVVIGLNELQDVFALRAVAFDNSNNRHEFNGWGGASSNNVWMRSFLMPYDRLSWDNLKHVGIEKMTNDNQRTVIVPQAAKRLKDAGVEVLMYPEIGRPYPFELTTMNGAKISSKSLQGKVILFDFWASWCSPCLQLIPDLKKTYAELKDGGFEVIGINLDDTVEKARQVMLKEDLPWPTFMAPTNKEQHDLWQTAAGIQSIPRLWLVDRKGILRADVYPHQLQDEIRKLVKE